MVARESTGGYWGVLRGTTNPLLLVRASDEAKTEGEANLKSIIVPLDGSEFAEQVLPTIAELAKQLNLDVFLFRAYKIHYTAYADTGATMRSTTRNYWRLSATKRSPIWTRRRRGTRGGNSKSYTRSVEFWDRQAGREGEANRRQDLRWTIEQARNSINSARFSLANSGTDAFVFQAV
jgi:hypothetical protein